MGARKKKSSTRKAAAKPAAAAKAARSRGRKSRRAGELVYSDVRREALARHLIRRID